MFRERPLDLQRIEISEPRARASSHDHDPVRPWLEIHHDLVHERACATAGSASRFFVTLRVSPQKLANRAQRFNVPWSFCSEATDRADCRG